MRESNKREEADRNEESETKDGIKWKKDTKQG